MKNHRHLLASIALTLVIGIGSALAQGRPPATLAVSIAFAGQSAGDQTKPNVEVTLTNTSGHSVKVLQPGAEG